MINLKLLTPLLLAVACTSTPSPVSPPAYRFTDDAPIDTFLHYAANGTDAEKMFAYYNLSFDYATTNKNLSVKYGMEYARLTQQANLKNLEGVAYSIIASAYGYNAQFDSALFYNEKAMRIFEEIKLDYDATLTKKGQAQYLENLFRFDEALKLFQECLDFFSSSEKYIVDQTRILQNIGTLYKEMGLYDLSIDYYEQALNIFHSLEQNNRVLRDIGCCHQGIGSNLLKKEEYQKSMEHYEKSLEFFRQINDQYYSGYSFGGLAECYLALSKDEEFQKLMSEFDEFAKKLNNQLFLFSVSHKKAKYYYQQRQYKKSLEYAQTALSFVSKSDKSSLVGLYETLALASAYSGTPHETAGYIEKLNQLKKEVFDEDRNKSVAEMEARYETAKKELQINHQQNVIARQNTQRNALAAGIAISVLLLVLLWYMLALRSRRNRALIERNDALAEMNATKNRFFGIISHDLKDPALSQRNALQKLIKHAQQWDAEALMEYYHDLLKSAEGQVELIYNLLGWAQIQTGRMAYTPDTVIISDALPDLSLIRKMAENKGITFAAEIPQNAVITCDRNMLATVIRNLLTNAIKYTAPGGTVNFSVSPCTDAARHDTTKYNFTIADTGTGMSPDQIQNLFHLDKSQSQQGTSGEQGSGLGLIVCKELLDKHGSVLHIESEEGKGSRFWFSV